MKSKHPFQNILFAIAVNWKLSSGLNEMERNNDIIIKRLNLSPLDVTHHLFFYICYVNIISCVVQNNKRIDGKCDIMKHIRTLKY